MGEEGRLYDNEGLKCSPHALISNDNETSAAPRPGWLYRLPSADPHCLTPSLTHSFIIAWYFIGPSFPGTSLAPPLLVSPLFLPCTSLRIPTYTLLHSCPSHPYTFLSSVFPTHPLMVVYCFFLAWYIPFFFRRRYYSSSLVGVWCFS